MCWTSVGLLVSKGYQTGLICLRGYSSGVHSSATISRLTKKLPCCVSLHVVKFMFLVAQTALLSATRRRAVVTQRYVSVAAQSRFSCSRLQTHGRQPRNKCLQIGSVEKPLDCHVGTSPGGERASTGYDLEAKQRCQDHQTAKYAE